MSLCWLNREHGYKACSGKLDAAHMIPKQRMKQAGCPDSGLWDERIIKWVCRAHHHSLDKKFIRLRYEQYPEDTREYAELYGWKWDGARNEWVATVVTRAMYEADSDDLDKPEPMSLLEE